jgi:hypothetical protein
MAQLVQLLLLEFDKLLENSKIIIGKTAFNKHAKCYCKYVEWICIEAVRRNARTSGATDEEVRDEVVRYLHGSKDRDGGRTMRKKYTQSATQNPDGEDFE